MLASSRFPFDFGPAGIGYEAMNVHSHIVVGYECHDDDNHVVEAGPDGGGDVRFWGNLGCLKGLDGGPEAQVF